MVELRQHFPLSGLLRLTGLPRSTFYYQQKALQSEDKDVDLKDRIRAIFKRHKGRYGYRRVDAELRQQGIVANHKKVQKLSLVFPCLLHFYDASGHHWLSRFVCPWKGLQELVL